MLQQGQGCIINISSRAAVFPDQVPTKTCRPLRAFMYAATKAALERLSQGLAVEYQAQGISVNVLLPGRARADARNVFGMTPPGGTPEPFEEAEAMGKAAVFIASQPVAAFTGTSCSMRKWCSNTSCSLGIGKGQYRFEPRCGPAFAIGCVPVIS